MLRVEVSEEGRPALPAIDVSEPVFVIGSAAHAKIRLPAAAARPEHVVIDTTADPPMWRGAEGAGALGSNHTFQIAGYRVRVAVAPPGALASLPQRTASLARELMRGLLGTDAAPSLTVERGPHVGATRNLPPPEGVYVVGRGDDAQWIFDDPELSKCHLEIRRSWDGTSAVDLASKNGTRLEGRALLAGAGAVELRDGMVLELGGIVLRYRDPAEAVLGGSLPPVASRLAAEPERSAPPPTSARSGRRGLFLTSLLISICAAAGLLWFALR